MVIFVVKTKWIQGIIDAKSFYKVYLLKKKLSWSPLRFQMETVLIGPWFYFSKFEFTQFWLQSHLIISQEFIWKRKNLKNEKPKRIIKVTSLFGQNGIWERQKVDDQIPIICSPPFAFMLQVDNQANPNPTNQIMYI